MRESRRLLAIPLLAVFTACQHLPWNARAVRDCPGELVPTQEIEGEFLLRQHLRVTAGDRSFHFELALQKRGDELVLVGLHALGAKLFTIRQIGSDVVVEAHPSPALDVPPENVLRDIHRVNFLRLPHPASDGIVHGRRGSTEIRERWDASKLRERRLLADDGLEGAVTIEFSEAAAPDGDVAAVNHPGCGYRAEFRTISRRNLP